MGLNKKFDVDQIEGLDFGIREAVALLNKYGFETFESCQGGRGHCFDVPTVRFFGDEFDLIRAYELCAMHNLNVSDAKRVYRKTTVYSDVTDGISIGNNWDKPFNELEFRLHCQTGTIFRHH
ncbi:MAG: hypothetical protein IPM51_12085 [Sphingobacteriaceae bacterium]|nr:hypothetical protein [Saprospiraceae bacterium]MBK9285036.1 hypothetical protein [Sphingobacteriaceae bacterium]